MGNALHPDCCHTGSDESCIDGAEIRSIESGPTLVKQDTLPTLLATSPGRTHEEDGSKSIECTSSTISKQCGDFVSPMLTSATDSFADFGAFVQASQTDAGVDDADGSPCVGHMFSDGEKDLLRKFQRHMTQQLAVAEKANKAAEYAQLLKQSQEQMRIHSVPAALQNSLPANRFGPEARLPAFEAGKHVPVLALINPFSGAMVGSDILAIARKSPYYQDRFFNIIDVVKDQRRGGLLDVLRIELCKAKDEAKAMGVRPRIISGGGDGTASFSLFIIFAALRADDTRAEEGLADAGSGFIWTDQEMAESFPALAQMPLGSANDFGNTLGWGQKYPGFVESRCSFDWRKHALRGLRTWIEAAISQESQVANFDVFGILPEEGARACDFKLAELSGRRGMCPKVLVDGEKQLVMKEAGLPVPLFLCLYFSAGFGAYMTARFQLNRRNGPLRNKLEYAKQAAGILAESIPKQMDVCLKNVQINCGNERYFPPRDSDGGEKYREVGFLNINWQAGMSNGADRAPLLTRLWSSREPAKFNDSKMDMYRLKLASILRNPGFKYQTDKRDEGLTLTHTGGKGKGIFFQWDGESRFAFSPTGKDFHIHIRKILNIPVVLGPGYQAQVTGDPDNGKEVSFFFAGNTLEESERFRQRVLAGVCGRLDSELIATKEELQGAGVPVDA